MTFSKSISFKLIIAALVIVTLVLGAFGAYNYMSQRNHLLKKQNHSLDQTESRLKLNLPRAIWNYEENQINNILNSEQQSSDVAFIQVLNESGTVTAQSKGAAKPISRTFKLQYIEDDTPNNVGSIKLFVDETSIEEEMSNLLWSILFKTLLLDIILLSALYVLLTQVVTRPLGEVADALENISRGEGDLTRRLTTKTDDEIGLVASSFNEFVDKIQSLVKSIQQTAKQATSLSSNVCDASGSSQMLLHEQQHETDQVAAAITEMSASSKEIENNVSLTAESANQASENANEVSNIIQTSIESINSLSEQLDHAVSVVAEVEKDVEGIGSVMDVIRGIAEQTNLLALNAAIEAARAGEQGRGFAVVADEVRALASRTQESTSEIQNTIQKLQSGANTAVEVMNQSQKSSETSVAHAQSSGDSIASILSSTQNINDMASQIAAAVSEQTQVAEELSSNINRIVEAGHGSLEQISSMATDAEQMHEIAEKLNKLTQQFKA